MFFTFGPTSKNNVFGFVVCMKKARPKVRESGTATCVISVALELELEVLLSIPTQFVVFFIVYYSDHFASAGLLLPFILLYHTRSWFYLTGSICLFTTDIANLLDSWLCSWFKLLHAVSCWSGISIFRCWIMVVDVCLAWRCSWNRDVFLD